jgi:hypothetical protein
VVRWAPFDNATGTIQSPQAPVDIAGTSATIAPGIWGPPDAAGIRYAVMTISTIDRAFPHWTKPVVVTIRDRNGLLDVVGIVRPTELPDLPDGGCRARR